MGRTEPKEVQKVDIKGKKRKVPKKDNPISSDEEETPRKRNPLRKGRATMDGSYVDVHAGDSDVPISHAGHPLGEYLPRNRGEFILLLNCK